MTSAPPAMSARALASPEAPSPKIATLLPEKAVMGITLQSPQLERGESRERQHYGHDPEANHDLRLGPPELLEVMMDRRHAKHAFAGELVRRHLHDHRYCFQHEQAADYRQHDLMLGRDSDGADQAAQRERAGIAHEYRGGRRVEPEKSEPGSGDGAAQHRELSGAGDIMNIEILGKERVADQVGNDTEADGNDDHRHRGQTVETIGEVHGIARADDDEGAKYDIEPAERNDDLLEERNGQRA